MEDELTPDKDTEQVTPAPEEETTEEPEVKPDETSEEAPDWLDVAKYGKPGMTIAEIKEKQAMAYPEAEKRMNQAINEGNSTKKEISSMKATLESLKAGLNVQPSLDINNISDEFRAQVAREFGDGVTAEQVVMQQKLLEANLKPIKDAALESKWELTEAKLKADPLFAQFPELLEKVESLPLADRLDKENIKKIKADFITEKLPEILENAKLEGVKSVTVKPAPGQTTEKASKPDKPVVKKVVLSDEQREYITAHGGNPKETEDYINRDTKVKVGYLNYAD